MGIRDKDRFLDISPREVNSKFDCGWDSNSVYLSPHGYRTRKSEDFQDEYAEFINSHPDRDAESKSIFSFSRRR